MKYACTCAGIVMPGISQPCRGCVMAADGIVYLGPAPRRSVRVVRRDGRLEDLRCASHDGVWSAWDPVESVLFACEPDRRREHFPLDQFTGRLLPDADGKPFPGGVTPHAWLRIVRGRLLGDPCPLCRGGQHQVEFVDGVPRLWCPEAEMLRMMLA